MAAENGDKGDHMKKKIILMVDDVQLNHKAASLVLQDTYELYEALSAKEAFEIMETVRPDLILLDVIMPGMDGYEMMRILKSTPCYKTIPVIFLTAETRAESEVEGFNCGIVDYITKPFVPIVMKKRIETQIALAEYERSLEEKVAEQTETLREQYKLLKVQAERLKQSNDNIIDILGTVVEHRNLESGEHVRRVKGYTKIMAEEIAREYPEYGLTPEKIGIIVSASALHDLGKIAIPDSILLKPGRFTKEEFECMKTHTVKGCEIVSSIEGVWDEEYAKIGYEISRYHHERYDGRGYPDGLKGEEIPISAQLVSVADVYDALVNERVYKDALPKDKAFEMIVNGECGTFSPKLMVCFRKARDRFESLAENIPAKAEKE